jgi:hypothetical protein
VTSSGDGGGGSNCEESEREKGASSGREVGKRSSTSLYRDREGRGEGAEERERRPIGASRPLMVSTSMEGRVGRRNGRFDAP